MSQVHIVALAFIVAIASATGGFLLHKQSAMEEAPTAAVPREVENRHVKLPEDVIGQKAPPFQLNDMQGQRRSLQEWQGKVVAVNFWATWCPPCRDEIPYFVELQHAYEEQGLQFIGVALQTAEEIREFVKEYGVNYPSLVGRDDVIATARSLGNDIGALPYTVIIDRDGVIRFTRQGPLTREEAEEVISALL